MPMPGENNWQCSTAVSPNVDRSHPCDESTAPSREFPPVWLGCKAGAAETARFYLLAHTAAAAAAAALPADPAAAATLAEVTKPVAAAADADCGSGWAERRRWRRSLLPRDAPAAVKV
eukprot:364640-Chlamydomonas_euryale.AAC.24